MVPQFPTSRAVFDKEIKRKKEWGGTIDPWALRFLVAWEIDCGNWLARGYMPANQHCDLFYPLGWGSDWVYHKLGNAPVLRSGTGSWVLSG